MYQILRLTGSQSRRYMATDVKFHFYFIATPSTQTNRNYHCEVSRKQKAWMKSLESSVRTSYCWIYIYIYSPTKGNPDEIVISWYVYIWNMGLWLGVEYVINLNVSVYFEHHQHSPLPPGYITFVFSRARLPPPPLSLPGLLARTCVGTPPRWESMWK